MNYMKQVAQMLGVELEEEFKLKDYYNHALDGTFYLDSYGAFKKGYVTPMNNILIDIIVGEIEIIKLSKPILDDVEKRYLSNFIRPIRKDIVFIQKTDRCVKDELEYLTFQIHDLLDDSYYMMNLPCFKKGTMYKGMELDKEYTLEELGL